MTQSQQIIAAQNLFPFSNIENLTDLLTQEKPRVSNSNEGVMPLPVNNYLKTPDEIKKMRTSGRMVAEILQMLREAVRPGVSTAELDAIAEREIRRRGAAPAFKGYGDPPFPGSIR